ncbi:MAG: winged helix-turn-helix domain-containing protein [Victivallaceae bacterium]|nr:winged helix-turn-helix domain-containing protein [Victivallaceae bacterium]
MTEVQKIWYRVMSILYRAGEQSIRIPSSNEFAQEFGIARSTVRIALEKLTQDGYLLTRRGSGTFTNPKACIGCNGAPLIGLMVLDCNLFYYTPEIQRELTCFYQELATTGWNVRTVTGQITSEAEARSVLAHNYLDGAISFGCRDFAVRAASSLMPTVNLGLYAEGATNVYPDCTKILEKLQELWGRDGAIHVWSAMPENSRDTFLMVLQRAQRIRLEFGSQEDPLFNEGFFEKNKAVFARKCPDWIVTYPLLLPPLRSILGDLYGEERVRKIFWIFRNQRNSDRNWPGFRIEADRSAEIRAAVGILKRKLQGEQALFSDVGIPARLIRDSDNFILA